ncbi:MAG: emp24p/erv25p- protein [Geoglossum umbratile]|nr:MAG: emp24p/erv25p- protein [Geoglossum umbratile]
MARLRMRVPQALTAFALISLVIPAQSLFFYLDAGAPKCFFEELPKDTLVVGHYSAEEFNAQSGAYEANPQLGINIWVDEAFDNDHRVVNVKGATKGSFTFSAAESGEHKLCFTAISTAHNAGWTAGSLGAVKLSLDMAIGTTSDIESSDKGKIQDIVQKVKDLNGRLLDIKREQMFQRAREAEFRDQSESTNSRVVRWTLLQLAVLGITCAWQLSHLRAFFIKQKLT